MAREFIDFELEGERRICETVDGMVVCSRSERGGEVQGIDANNQDPIFDVFERLHTADENGGTGIGSRCVSALLSATAGISGPSPRLVRG
ncbi:MAG: hypothetical protein ABEH81_06460 [Halopenitus sp.]